MEGKQVIDYYRKLGKAFQKLGASKCPSCSGSGGGESVYDGICRTCHGTRKVPWKPLPQYGDRFFVIDSRYKACWNIVPVEVNAVGQCSNCPLDYPDGTEALLIPHWERMEKFLEEWRYFFRELTGKMAPGYYLCTLMGENGIRVEGKGKDRQTAVEEAILKLAEKLENV